jgi:hypothetical protein
MSEVENNTPFVPEKELALEFLRGAKGLIVVGYSESDRWLGVGYLAEAESVVAGLSRALMAKIRESRHEIEERNGLPNIDELIGMVEGLGK